MKHTVSKSLGTMMSSILMVIFEDLNIYLSSFISAKTKRFSLNEHHLKHRFLWCILDAFHDMILMSKITSFVLIHF